MVCIDQCPLEASAPRNVFDDAQHSRLVQPICDANGSAHYPYPTLLTVEAAYGHLDAHVRTARHIRDTSQDHRERNRVVEALAAQPIECLDRTSVHALDPCAFPAHGHSPPARAAPASETRPQDRRIP